MIDRLIVRMSAQIGVTRSDPTAGLFRHYKGILARRSAGGGGWRRNASKSEVRCVFAFKPSNRVLINEATLMISGAGDRIEARLTVNLNPLRILRHRLEHLPDIGAVEHLRRMETNDFFAAAEIDHTAATLDKADNVLPNPAVAISKLGVDYIDVFLPIFEDKLQRWSTEAFAPASEGFNVGSNALTANTDALRIEVGWNDMTVLLVEAFFERRFSDAKALMDRLSLSVPQAHVETGVRRYHEDDIELGGRRLGSAVVGFTRTATVHQVFYAKFRDRIRAETRYLKAVRNAVGATRSNSPTPLRALLEAVRRDAIKRTKWNIFCAMCAEPKSATLDNVATMIALIAECTRGANVAFRDVFAALLNSGGIDETGPTGATPRRLMRRLEQAGLIERSNLNRRRRPGETRRHALTNDWLEIVRRLKAAFDAGEEHQSNNT